MFERNVFATAVFLLFFKGYLRHISSFKQFKEVVFRNPFLDIYVYRTFLDIYVYRTFLDIYVYRTFLDIYAYMIIMTDLY